MPTNAERQLLNLITSIDELKRFISWGEIFQFEAGGGDSHDQEMLDGLKALMENEVLRQQLEAKGEKKSSIEKETEKAKRRKAKKRTGSEKKPGKPIPKPEIITKIIDDSTNFDYKTEWPKESDYH